MEEPKTESETPVAAAPDFCVYTVTKDSNKLKPPLKNNDTLCIPCPEDKKCRGLVGRPLKQLVIDAAGNEERVQMQLKNAKCMACPAGGKQGYKFGKTGSDVC